MVQGHVEKETLKSEWSKAWPSMKPQWEPLLPVELTQGGAEAFGFGHVECVRHFLRHTGNNMRSEAGQSVWDVGDGPQLGM